MASLTGSGNRRMVRGATAVAPQRSALGATGAASRPWPALRPYAVLAAFAAAVTLAGFAAATAAGLPVLTDPESMLDGHLATAAMVGVVLLVVDVALPVPSSVVMVAHGTLFGIVPGALLSLAGRVGAGIAGAAIGRAGRGWAARRSDNTAKAARLVERWGAVAVVATRPVPVFAEAVVVAAGAAAMPWRRLVAAVALGALPEAVLYAVAGAVAVSFNSTALVFGSLLVASCVAFLVWARTPPPRSAKASL